MDRANQTVRKQAHVDDGKSTNIPINSKTEVKKKYVPMNKTKKPLHRPSIETLKGIGKFEKATELTDLLEDIDTCGIQPKEVNIISKDMQLTKEEPEEISKNSKKYFNIINNI